MVTSFTLWKYYSTVRIATSSKAWFGVMIYVQLTNMYLWKKWIAKSFLNHDLLHKLIQWCWNTIKIGKWYLVRNLKFHLYLWRNMLRFTNFSVRKKWKGNQRYQLKNTLKINKKYKHKNWEILHEIYKRRPLIICKKKFPKNKTNISTTISTCTSIFRSVRLCFHLSFHPCILKQFQFLQSYHKKA